MKQTEDKTQRKHSVRFFRFALVSSITGLVGLGSFALLVMIFRDFISLVSYDVGVVVAEFVSVLFSCVCSFFLNKKFTFRDRNARRLGILLYILYYAVTTPLASWAILWLNKAGINIILCKIIKMTVNLVLDFLYCRYFIFKYIKKKFDETPIVTEEVLPNDTVE